MKNKSITWLCVFALIFSFLISVSGCSTQYLIEKSTGNEYVQLKELPLNPVDRFILHWKTTYDSPFAKLDSRSGKFFYLKTYDYSKVLLVKTVSIQNNINNQSKEVKFVVRLLWILVCAAAALFLIIWWHHSRNGDDEDDSYPL
jgi:hypothetical protein